MTDLAQNDNGERPVARIVLAVHRDASIVATWSAALRTVGCVVLTAGTGDEALRQLLSEDGPRAQVIVVDSGIAAMPARELLQLLKGYTRLSRTPVLLASPVPPFGTVLSMVSGWLQTPFDIQDLVVRVDELCRHAPRDSMAPGNVG
jgi:DNA-binding response OmpR family regulator